MEKSLVVRTSSLEPKLTHVAKHAASDQTNRPVPHWGLAEVHALVEAAKTRGRGVKGERDGLLIQILFDAALRCGEALGLRPADIIRTDGGYRLQVQGKTGYRQVAVSVSLVARIQSFRGQEGLGGQSGDDHRNCCPFEGYPGTAQKTVEFKALNPNWGYAPCSYLLDGPGPP